MAKANRKQTCVEQAGGALMFGQVPSEEYEQTKLMEWAELMEDKHPELMLLHHIPNGGKRGKAEAARLKKAGVKAGVPDLFLPAPRHSKANGENYSGLYVEMKALIGGRVSAEQKEWIRLLRAQGYAVEVCRGWQEAVACIIGYLEGRYSMRWEDNSHGRSQRA